MINALIAIGCIFRDRYSMPLAEPYSGKNCPLCVVVNLEETSNGLKVLGCVLEDFDYENYEKYVFKEKKGRGAAKSLSFSYPPNLSLEERLKILKTLGYEVNLKQISQEIKKYIDELKKEGKISSKASLLIVLKVNESWPIRNRNLINFLQNEFFSKLGDQKYSKYWRKKWICHGCGKEKEVYGGVGDLLKFYTVDKYGYAPELDPRGAWRQYALCRDCILDLERGKRARDEFLTYSFYGKEFWLLPVASEALEAILKRFENFHESGGELYKDSYEVFEDRLLYEASRQEGGILFYHFVFTKREQQALRILLHLEEVLPSLIARYLRVKQKVEAEFNDFIDLCSISQTFRFNFFSSPGFKVSADKPGFTDEDFYALVDTVFRKTLVEERLLISKAMSRIRKEFLDPESGERVPWWLVLDAFLQLYFLLSWGVLKRKIFPQREDNMKDQLFAKFFEPYQEFLDHPAKKALVLLGVLIQKFLNYQYKERNSTPFVKRLKGLRLNQNDVQDLFRELSNKMNEYGIGHWWRELREGISMNFMAAGNRWPLSVDEVGFYLAIGMSLSGHPIFKSKEEEKNTEEVS